MWLRLLNLFPATWGGTIWAAIVLLLSLFFSGETAYKLRVLAAAVFGVAATYDVVRWLISLRRWR